MNKPVSRMYLKNAGTPLEKLGFKAAELSITAVGGRQLWGFSWSNRRAETMALAVSRAMLRPGMLSLSATQEKIVMAPRRHRARTAESLMALSKMTVLD
jgi:hypothetical protein